MIARRWCARGMPRARSDAVPRPLLLLVFLPTLGFAADIPLSRDPQTYLVLGMQRTVVNSLSLEPPGCNVGVNCAPSVGGGRSCGFFHSRNGQFPAPSQLAANQVCGTKSFFQVFSKSIRHEEDSSNAGAARREDVVPGRVRCRAVPRHRRARTQCRMWKER